MGGAAREGLDAHLIAVVSQYANQHQCKSFTLVGPPPRRVALAMALAILAQPHLSVTFSDLDPVGEDNTVRLIRPYSESPLIIDTENLCEALALSAWELDQLREEIDRNVSYLLKQQRALRWLWARYAEPKDDAEGLLSILFSGISSAESRLYGIGGQLYGLLDGQCLQGPNALYTPFLNAQNQDGIRPRGTFVGKFLDSSLIHNLAKGIGADEEETLSLLHNMISCVPRDKSHAYVGRDMWRIMGFDRMTHLTQGYSATQWLTAPLDPKGVHPMNSWIDVGNGLIDVPLAEHRFDSLVIPRIQMLMNQTLAQNLTQLLIEDHPVSTSSKHPWVSLNDIDLLALKRHMNSVVAPVLSWPKSVTGAQNIATISEGTGLSVAEIQKQITEIWTQRYQSLWISAPKASGHQSTLTRLIAHQCRRVVSHRKIWHRSPIYGLPHRHVMALFSGFYFSEIPLERCWHEAGDAQGADPVGQWFWPTWQHILNTMEDASISTFTDFD